MPVPPRASLKVFDTCKTKCSKPGLSRHSEIEMNFHFHDLFVKRKISKKILLSTALFEGQLTIDQHIQCHLTCI